MALRSAHRDVVVSDAFLRSAAKVGGSILLPLVCTGAGGARGAGSSPCLDGAVKPS
jgi:hypothetical protein